MTERPFQFWMTINKRYVDGLTDTDIRLALHDAATRLAESVDRRLIGLGDVKQTWSPKRRRLHIDAVAVLEP